MQITGSAVIGPLFFRLGKHDRLLEDRTASKRADSIYIVGVVALLLTSIPAALHQGYGLGGYIFSLICIGCGVGGVRSSLSAFLGMLE